MGNSCFQKTQEIGTLYYQQMPQKQIASDQISIKPPILQKQQQEITQDIKESPKHDPKKFDVLLCSSEDILQPPNAERNSKQSAKSSLYSKLQNFSYRKQIIAPSQGPAEEMMQRMQKESSPPDQLWVKEQWSDRYSDWRRASTPRVPKKTLKQKSQPLAFSNSLATQNRQFWHFSNIRQLTNCLFKSVKSSSDKEHCNHNQMNMFQGLIGGRNVNNVRPGPRTITFFRELHVYPAHFAAREDINKGDKILLPSSALNELYPLMTSANKDPMIFCLKNGNRLTYCGVLQFVAEEGLCYIPDWMFKMLKFTQGAQATLALVTDMRKKYGHIQHKIKIQPHQTKFIDLSNPKAILQYQLRNFTCLHEGDTIAIQVFKDRFYIDILEITPKNEYGAICLIEADVEVDFAPPLDYVQPTPMQKEANFSDETSKKGNVFAGTGVRIDEKKGAVGNRKQSANIESNQEDEYDPRKHRIHRGVRKTSIDFQGQGVKLGAPAGTKPKK